MEGHPLFGEEFFKDPIRTSRWNGFLKSIRTKEQIAFEEVGNLIQEKMKGYWLGVIGYRPGKGYR